MLKLLDRLLKPLAVDDPRALYHLLSEPLPSEDAEIEPMVQEIVTKLSALDYWCVFRTGKRERADVFEFKGKYEAGMHRRLFRYAMAACVTTGFSVRATAIIVSSKGFRGTTKISSHSNARDCGSSSGRFACGKSMPKWRSISKAIHYCRWCPS